MLRNIVCVRWNHTYSSPPETSLTGDRTDVGVCIVWIRWKAMDGEKELPWEIEGCKELFNEGWG